MIKFVQVSTVFTLVILVMWLTGCKDKVICPAFQSTYILDDSLRYLHFSLFDTNMQPKMTASLSKKNRYGVMKRDPMFIKNYKLKTSPMENVLTPDSLVRYYATSKDDSLLVSTDSSTSFSDSIVSTETGEDDLFETIAEEDDDLLFLDENDSTFKDEGEFFAEDFADSLSEDSTGVPVLAQNKEPEFLYGYDPKDKFNQEQFYYNKYFGKMFIPRKRPASSKNQKADSTQTNSLATDSTTINQINGLGNEVDNIENLPETLADSTRSSYPNTPQGDDIEKNRDDD